MLKTMEIEREEKIFIYIVIWETDVELMSKKMNQHIFYINNKYVSDWK